MTGKAPDGGVQITSWNIAPHVVLWLRETPFLYQIHQSKGIRVLCLLYGGHTLSADPVLSTGVGQAPATVQTPYDAWLVFRPLSSQKQVPVALHDQEVEVLFKFMKAITKEIAKD